MDSNGTRFVLIKGPCEFRTARRDCGWNPVAGAFTLTRQDQPRLPRLDTTRALELWAAATPYVLDDHGQIGRLSADRRTFEWSLSWPGDNWQPVRAAIEGGIAKDAAAVTLDPVDAPAGATFTDLHLGGSGLVALPFSNGTDTHGLLLTHLRRRWQASCSLPFAPVRAWVDGEDRVWVAGEDKLGLCRGAPLPQPYIPRDDRFEPVEINPDPLRLMWQQPLPEHGGLMALAADDDSLVLLVQNGVTAGGQQLLTRALNSANEAPITTYPVPADLPLATDITCLGQNQLLLLLPFEEGDQRDQRRDCALLLLTASRSGAPVAQLLPERWPRRSEAGVRFVRHRDNTPRTLTEEGVTPLYRLAQARFPHQASAVLTLPFDSGAPGTIWHRLCIEACIPPGCRIEVEAQAFEVWRDRPRIWEKQPAPGWLPIPSELPFATDALTPAPEREGLFEVLLQRPNGAVRDLAGRYLRLRLTLSGDGRHTPAIYAMRAWYPRFSWQAHFLPGHFHQQQALPATTPTATEAANGADLRERLLACFEGLMTPIEERIAAAETLLYPDATPAPFLPWLAQMNATRLPAHWPEPRQRRWLAQQGQLQQQRGTFGGLVRALDIITDGGVRRGEVAPVELFRLRRTLATILGISLDDANHPLTLGTGQSGNSLVGESLILADDHAREFLALFAPELAKGKLERQTVERFFDKYARRLTVVLHGPARQQRQVVAEALPGLVPAVVQWNIMESDHPFVLGLSPLLRIDTYLEKEPPPGRVQLNRSRLGRGHLLQNPVALAPEHAGAVGGESNPP
jgi:phage tail-like protein